MNSAPANLPATAHASAPLAAEKFVTCSFPADIAVAELLYDDSGKSTVAGSKNQNNQRRRIMAQGKVKLPVDASISVNLTYAAIEHADSLDQLSALNLNHFSAAKLEMEDGQMEHIRNFRTLLHANFDNTLITDKSLPIIGNFKNLYSLRLSATDITGSGFAALNGLPLVNFNINGINLQPGTLSKIKTLPQHVMDLNVSKTNLTAQDLSYIGTCHNLTSLDITGNKKVDDECVKNLLKLTNLHTLLLGDTSITEKSLPALSKMPCLKKLAVRSNTFWRKGFGKSPRASLIIQDVADSNRLGVDIFRPLH